MPMRYNPYTNKLEFSPTSTPGPTPQPRKGMWTALGYVNPVSGQNFSQGTGTPIGYVNPVSGYVNPVSGQKNSQGTGTSVSPSGYVKTNQGYTRPQGRFTPAGFVEYYDKPTGAFTPYGYDPDASTSGSGSTQTVNPLNSRNTAIVQGLDSSGAVDRRQSDDYRSAIAQYAPQPMTAEGQFKRYFGTPEFDYVFGSGARGQGAPKTAEEMMYLGTNTQARDAKTNLATLYASQSAAGRVNQDLIQRRYDEDPTLTAEQKTNLKEWASKNPMIAQREYTKWLEKGGFNRPEGEELAQAYGSSSNASGGDTSMYPGIGFDASKMLTVQVNPQEGSRYPGTGFDAAQLLTAGLDQQSATANQADQATTTGVGRGRRNLAAETEQFLKNLRTVEY